MTVPTVSLVIPSYNQAAFLERTLLSVLGQTYSAIECIVIDGGSTDGSVEIVRNYAHRLAWWVSEPDGGQADAINKGFAKATGDYLGWINSDDLLYPKSIAVTAGFLDAHPEIDFVYGDVDQGIDEATATRLPGKATTLENMLKTFEMPIPQQGSLWRRSVVEAVGGLDPRWQVVLDREFFLRVAGCCAMAYLPEVLGFFRVHPESKSVAWQTLWLEELPAMYEDYFAVPDLPPERRDLRWESLGSVYIQCAWLAAKNGLPGRALAFLAKAVAIDPGFPFKQGVRTMLRRYFSRLAQ